MRFSKAIKSAAIGAAIITAPLAAQATTVALHMGATDPTTAGWGTNGSFNGVTTGAVIDDEGSGIDAWKVEDRGTAAGDLGWYTYTLTPGQIANATTYGWKLSANVRVVDVPDPAPGAPALATDASPVFAYRNGSQSFQLHLGTQADGDPIAHILQSFSPHSGVEAALEGAGAGYHLYEMVYDLATSGIDVFIDGTEVLSDVPALSLPGTTTDIIFGAGSSCCEGQGNFNLVKFETFEPPAVPLPASLPLAGLGLAAFAALRRRRVRT